MSRPVIYKLANAARNAWMRVRQSEDDPVVRARGAFRRIKARGEVPGFQWLESDIRVALRRRQRLTDALQIVGEDEEALVYALIAKLAYERLQSGQHHVASGRLSSTERQLHAAYKYAARRLIQLGVYEPATYEEDCALLREKLDMLGLGR